MSAVVHAPASGGPCASAELGPRRGIPGEKITRKGLAAASFDGEAYGGGCISFSAGEPLVLIEGADERGWAYGAAGRRGHRRWGRIPVHYWCRPGSRVAEAVWQDQSERESNLRHQLAEAQTSLQNVELQSERTAREQLSEQCAWREHCEGRMEAQIVRLRDELDDAEDSMRRRMGSLEQKLSEEMLEGQRSQQEEEVRVLMQQRCLEEYWVLTQQRFADEEARCALHPEALQRCEADLERAEAEASEYKSFLVSEKHEAEAQMKELQNQLSKSAPVQGAPTLDGWEWQFTGQDGQWCSMPAETSKQLMPAYFEYRSGGDASRKITSGTHEYEFHFETMVQVNTRTKVQRQIRWKFDIPQHWATTNEILIERHVQALPKAEIPMREGMPGCFHKGQKVFCVDRSSGSPMRFGEEGVIEGPCSDGDRALTHVRVRIATPPRPAATQIDVPARSLSLVGPEVAGGFRAGQRVYATVWPATTFGMFVIGFGTVGIVEMSFKKKAIKGNEVLIQWTLRPGDYWVQGQGVRSISACNPGLCACDVGSISACNPGAEEPLIGDFRKYQIVFAKGTWRSPREGFPGVAAGAMLRIEGINGNDLVLRHEDVLAVPRHFSSTLSYKSELISIRPEPFAGGFQREQEVAWWRSDGTLWRGVAKGVASSECDEHISIDFDGTRHDCAVQQLSESICSSPRPSPLTRLSDENMIAKIQQVLQKSSYHHCQRGAKSCGMPKTLQELQVKAVFHVENWSLWRQFTQNINHMEDDLRLHDIMATLVFPELNKQLAAFAQESCPTKSAVNEVLLFHGTASETARQIAERGFDDRVSRQGYYGMGTYFAPQLCKSHQYSQRTSGAAGLHTIIISRVALGEVHAASKIDKDMRRPPQGRGAGRPCDSVVAHPGVMPGHHDGFQTHQEVVIFERAQAYPEYIVEYSIGGQ